MLSGVLSAVVIVVSMLVTMLLTQCINQPILTLIVAMKSVLGETPWRQQGKPGTTPGQPKAPGLVPSKVSSINKAPPAVAASPDAQTPQKRGEELSTFEYPAALAAPSTLSSPSMKTALLPADLLRTSSSSAYGSKLSTTRTIASPAAVTRSLLPSDGTSSAQFTPSHSHASLAQLQWHPTVYGKALPPPSTIELQPHPAPEAPQPSPQAAARPELPAGQHR